MFADVDSVHVALGIIMLLVLVASNKLLEVSGRLTRLERKMDALLSHHNITPPEMSERVQALAKDPNLKIAAIKALRLQANLGLVEAKNWVESYYAQVLNGPKIA